jgi:3-hydroxypropionyl-coenzyme A dehydratase
MGECVLLELHERIALITLNRPERLNAVNQQLWDEFGAALDTVHQNPDVWAVVVTGRGRAFCAGADLGDVDRTGIGEEALQAPARMYQLGLGLLWKPVIAAVNGYALAAGWWIAQACDVRIAAQSAQFGIPETRWNLRADFVTDLTRIVGLGHALEIAMWGDRRISAERAYQMGFVNQVVPDAEVVNEAMDWARRACRLGPRSVAVIKESLYRGWGAPTEAGSDLARSLGLSLAGMSDTQEGPRAFLERRAPRYQNR